MTPVKLLIASGIDRLLVVPLPSSPTVVAPGPDGSAGRHCQAVSTAGGYGRDTREADSLHRCVLVDLCTIPQFAVLIVPPALNGAIALRRESKLQVRTDVFRKGARRRIGCWRRENTRRLDDRFRTLIRIPGSQLTVGVVAPGPYRAVRLQCQTEFRPPRLRPRNR